MQKRVEAPAGTARSSKASRKGRSAKNVTSGLARGKGTVDQLPSGRWRARVAGQTVQGGPWGSEEEAIRALLELEWVPVVEGTVGEFVAQWLEMKRPTMKPRGYGQLEGVVRRHIVGSDPEKPTALSELQWDVVDQLAIQAWWQALDVGAPTKAKAWRQLSAILDAARKAGLLRAEIVEPVASAGKEPVAEIVIPSTEEVQRLISAAPDRYRVALVIAAGAGLRFEEIVGLKVRDVDLAKQTIRVRQVTIQNEDGKILYDQDPKSAASKRTLPVSAEVCDEIAGHINEFTDGLPGSRLVTTVNGSAPTRGNWSRMWRKMGEAIGVAEEITLHTLRHWHLTEFARQPGVTLRDIMDRGGHSSPASALRYQHASRSVAQVSAAAVGRNLFSAAPETGEVVT